MRTSSSSVRRERSFRSSRAMRTTVLIIALLSCAGSQAAPQPQIPVFRAGVDVLTVQASVLDRDGKPVIDLAPADFTVTIDGRPRRVRDARFYGDGGAEVVT